MKLPVIETTAAKPERNGHPKYADCQPLPASYMSEYSLLGLVVDEIDQAIEILSGNGFYIVREEFGAEVEIIGPDQVPDMVRILAGSGVYSSIGHHTVWWEVGFLRAAETLVPSKQKEAS
jgi:hypothetical protein